MALAGLFDIIAADWEADKLAINGYKYLGASESNGVIRQWRHWTQTGYGSDVGTQTSFNIQGSASSYDGVNFVHKTNDGEILMTVPFSCSSGFMTAVAWGTDPSEQKLICIRGQDLSMINDKGHVLGLPDVYTNSDGNGQCPNGYFPNPGSSGPLLPIYSNVQSSTSTTGATPYEFMSQLVGYGCVSAVTQEKPTPAPDVILGGCPGATRCMLPGPLTWEPCKAPGYDPDCYCTLAPTGWNSWIPATPTGCD